MRNRQGNEIKKWMIDHPLTDAEISRAVNVNRPLVGKTIKGQRNNRKVLRYLLERGCPIEIMDLPQDILDEIMREAA